MQTFLDFKELLNSNENIIVNELSLSYKRSLQLNDPQFKQLNSSTKVSNLLREIWDEGQLEVRESFYLLCFSTGLDLLGYQKISEGGLDAVVVDLRLLFSIALLSRATSIVIAHNHPSGTLKPSQADKILTEKIVQAGELFSIRVNDHIILTESGYYSFRDEGLL
ncbi:JAB domain-containing protein [Sphingobacterium rhinopitheci]|uniref:JAB domain-containing protein n=1 Tax=Sphingobacterium rhinopitheci TaxID=2781960 RepID=UPI001F520BCA|nr:JAB domain-containing protein [Sphingobacterium rhinopitheci]MCI0922413.1 JAB domain-containing protein [Sphingobacterium rhinopitheci]